MGKKLLLIGSQVALASVLGYFICLFLPLHKIYWKVGSFMDAVNMTVYALTVHYDWKMTRACKLVRLFVSKKDMCDKDVDGESASEHVALQDSASTWCSGGMQMTIRGACEGFKNAYIMGIMLLLFIIANLIMQGVGLFLIKEYMKKPKKQYRETAFFLNLIGGILMLVVVILYMPIATIPLDSMVVAGDAFSWLVGISDSIGVAWGYVLLYFFMIIQAVSIVLLANGSNTAEAREAELKEQKKFMQEQELFQQVEMTASYGGKGVTAPPNHWGQGVQEQGNWGGAGPPPNQAYPGPGPSYGYGMQPMPPMQGMHPQMSAPPMQQPQGGAVPYF